MSLLPNQTAVNKDNAFYALANSGVISLTEGSNIDITGTSNVPIISAVGGSINNTARYSELAASFSGAPGALADGASQTVLSIPAGYYSDATYLYRATICYEWGLATFAATPAGNMTLSFTNSAGGVLASHNVPFTANIANGDKNIGGVITTVFKPNGGTYGLSLLNNTGQTLTTGTILYTTYCIEQITTGLTVIAP